MSDVKKAILKPTVKLIPTRLWKNSEQRWYTINEDGTLTPEKEK